MTRHSSQVVLKVGSTGVVVDTDKMDVIHVGALSSLPQNVRDAALTVSDPGVSQALKDLVTSASDISLMTSSDDPIVASGKRTYRIPSALQTMFTMAAQNAAIANPEFVVPITVKKILANSSLSLKDISDLHNSSAEFWEEYAGEALRAWTKSVVASAVPDDVSQYVPVYLPEPPADDEQRVAEELSKNKTRAQRYATLDPDEEHWKKRAITAYNKLHKTSPTRAQKFRSKLRVFIKDLIAVSGENYEDVVKGTLPIITLESDKPETVIATGQGPTSTDTINPKKVKARLPQEPVLVADPSSLVSADSTHPVPREAKPSVAAAVGEDQTNGSSPTPPSDPQSTLEQPGPRNRATAGQSDTDYPEPTGEGHFVDPHSESGAWDTGPSGTLVTPDNTQYKDKIKYLAVVDTADVQSVLDLLSVVPQSENPGDVKVFVREGRAWVVSDKYLIQLRSTSPPPVVAISSPDLLSEIVSQIDAWEQKPGNEPDVDSLRAATYPIANPRTEKTTEVAQKIAASNSAADPKTPEPPAPATPAATAEAAVQNTTAQSTENTDSSAVTSDLSVPNNLPSATRVTFSIPLVLPEKLPSGDGRMFKAGALSARDLPIPLLWQQQGFDGHSGSVIVGRIDDVSYKKGKGLVNATGVFDDGSFALEAIRLIKNKMLRGISADLDNFEASMANKDTTKSTKSVGSPKMEISSARLMGVTLVAKPAFQECVITIKEEPVQDGVYVEKLPKSLTASATPPVDPPADWFEQPTLTEPTPLTIADDGKVFGHIALWDTDHIGMPNGTKPPKSTSNYAYFHTGIVKTADGNSLPVGQLTLAGGHAPLDATAAAAVRHYDDTASAVADVRAGEDDHGIWVSGAIRPGVNELQLRTLRASAPSGDWRPIKGALELVAVCQVNVPGFPITRARVASGHVTALVAAGASALAQLRIDREKSVDARLHQLEAGMDSVLKASAGFNVNTSTPEGLVAAAALQRARVNFRR